MRVTLTQPDYDATGSEITDIFQLEFIDENIAYLEALSFPNPTPEIQRHISDLPATAGTADALILALRRN